MSKFSPLSETISPAVADLASKILTKNRGIYKEKFYGIPTQGRWVYDETNYYCCTPTMLLALDVENSTNISWRIFMLSSERRIYMPYCNEIRIVYKLYPMYANLNK